MARAAYMDEGFGVRFYTVARYRPDWLRRTMADNGPTPSTRCSFEEMQLRVDERLQIELHEDGTSSQYYTTLIGYLPGHSVLLRTPTVQNLPIPVKEGAEVILRTFSGRFAYTIESRVERVCRMPYPYLHLLYPAEVSRTEIRDALRVRVNLTGTAANPETPGESRAVVVADLSVFGASVESDRRLAQVGGRLDLAFKFRVDPNQYEVKIVTPVEVQSVRLSGRERRDSEFFTHGVRFGGLHTTETLLLQSYIHQTLLADRSRVI